MLSQLFFESYQQVYRYVRVLSLRQNLYFLIPTWTGVESTLLLYQSTIFYTSIHGFTSLKYTACT